MAQHSARSCCDATTTTAMSTSTATTTTPAAPVLTFRMKGKSGQEKITVTIDGDVTTHTLSTSYEAFHFSWPRSGAYHVRFVNDAAGRDVYFEGVDPVSNSVEHMEYWKRWNCGSAKENVRCNKVRMGTFAWRGTYKITPK